MDPSPSRILFQLIGSIRAAKRTDCHQEHKTNQVDDPNDAAAQGNPTKHYPPYRITHFCQQSGYAKHDANNYRQQERSGN